MRNEILRLTSCNWFKIHWNVSIEVLKLAIWNVYFNLDTCTNVSGVWSSLKMVPSFKPFVH